MIRNTGLPTIMGVLLALICFIGVASAGAEDFPILEGPYLGQELPGLIPQEFALFIAPPEDHKHSAPVFSPDGTELFFSVYESYDYPQKIKVMRLVDGVWSAPVVAPFSGQYQEGGPVFSPYGNRLYFHSKRPQVSGDAETEKTDIWFVEKTPTGWSEPIDIGAPINTTEFDEHVATFSRSGNLVFSRDTAPRCNTLLEFPIDPASGRAASTNGTPAQAVPYDGPPTPPRTYSMGVSYFADGNVVIVHTFALDGSPSGLFVSQRAANGTWPELTLMGDMLNLGDARFCAISPDQKYLFFLSYRNGPEEIFWVDATIIDTILTYDLSLVDRLAETVTAEGAPAARTLYEQLQSQHAAYYVFNQEVFGTVGDRLMFGGDKASAALAYDLNHELFPAAVGLLDRLKLALARNDLVAFDKSEVGIPEPTDSTATAVERELNALGYQFLQAGLLDEALRILRLNVDSFPGSGNVYDSYAEALLQSGDTTMSIENYRMSLQVDSTNANARTVLQGLGIDTD